MSKYSDFEAQIAKRMESECLKSPDPSHDFLHVKRVVKWAKLIGTAEGANLDIVVPAAYLHDVVIIAKNDPRRATASRLSAIEAVSFLGEIGYAHDLLPHISHAIEAHSFTANIETKSLEAKVVQDADRLDGLGAIGIMRCFSLGGTFLRPFYNENDPFAESRIPNDLTNSLDHFYVKLFKVAETMKTKSGQAEAKKRVDFMREFTSQLQRETT